MLRHRRQSLVSSMLRGLVGVLLTMSFSGINAASAQSWLMDGKDDDATAFDTTITPPGFSEKTVVVKGMKRTYIVHAPASANPKKPIPLIIMFHGAQGTAKGQEGMTSFSKASDKRGYLLVLPQGVEDRWNDTRQYNKADDNALVDTILAQEGKLWNIDKSRIYLAGMSNGGLLVQVLAARRPGQFAALAAVAALPLADTPKPPKPVPIIFFQGTSDTIVHFNGGGIGIGKVTVGDSMSNEESMKFWATANKCSLKPTETKLPSKVAKDRTSVVCRAYKPGPGGGDVVEYIVNGGGHTWPGASQYLPSMMVGVATQQISANELILDFFDRHRLAR
jgi:polyhydroxybutyrate depolymerase